LAAELIWQSEDAKAKLAAALNRIAQAVAKTERGEEIKSAPCLAVKNDSAPLAFH
jgi:hypothetical protein